MDGTNKENVKINLDWDYDNGKMHLSMKPFCEKAVKCINNIILSVHQDSLYPHMPPNYGAKIQMADSDTSPTIGIDRQNTSNRYLEPCYGTYVASTAQY